MKPTLPMQETVLVKEKLVCWSAISAGVLAALLLGLLFELLGMAIGFSLFSPSNQVLYPLSIGTALWMILSGIIALYFGGWVAGRFSPSVTTESGALYGLMVSGISILISITIMASAVGTVLSGSFSALSKVVSASSSASGSIAEKVIKGASKISPELTDKVRNAIPDLKPITDKIYSKASSLVKENADVSPEKVKSQLKKLVLNYLDSIGEMNYEDARKDLVNMLVETTGKTPDEINQMVDDWKDSFESTKEKMVETTVHTTKKVARWISQLALINFLVLSSSVIAAAFGGINGVRNRLY